MLVSFSLLCIILVLPLTGMTAVASKTHLRKLQTCTGTDVDVFIIGAGLAGLAAAKEIEKFNDLNPPSKKVTYKVVDSASRYGGRMIAAHWIAGGEPNPIAQMVYDHYGNNFEYYDQQDWRDIERFDQQGNLLKYKDIRNDLSAWDDAYTCLQEKSFEYQEGTASFSDGARSVLKDQCGWDNDSGRKNAFEWYDMDYEFAQKTEEISLWSFPLGPYGVYQDKDYFITNRDINAELGAKEVQKYGLDVALETEVTEVDWNNIPAEVTAGGDTYCAEKVISTVSVGVLLNRGTSNKMFEPALPVTKTTDNVFKMAQYMGIYFQFDEKFWNDYQFMQIALPLEKRGRCSLWQNYDTRWENEFYHGSNTVVCVIITEVIEAIKSDNGGSIPQDAVNELLHESLGVAYPDANDYTCTFSYNWDPTDPPQNGCIYRFFDNSENTEWYGSYENWQVGKTIGDFDQFVAPLQVGNQNVIHFAGSATCLEQWGYMHGANDSGIKVAGTVLHELRPSNSKFPDSEQSCDPPPQGANNRFVKKSKGIKN